MQALHALRRDPYRLLFPEAIALSWWGIGQWILHGLGIIESYHSVFHALIQIQGFVATIAAGFLLTMLPRRTDSAPPSVFELAVAILAPLGLAISAWLQQWPLSQIFWLFECVVLLRFVVLRSFSPLTKRPPPDCFVWLPFAFFLGIVGSVFTAIGAALGHDHWWLHEIGRRIVLQGMPVALVIGASGLVIPLMCRGERPADGNADTRTTRLAHFALMLLFSLGFWVEHRQGIRPAALLRLVVITAAFIFGAHAHRRPSLPGLHRWLIWIALWCVPLGFFFSALWDEHWKIGLHISLIGGVSLLCLTISAHVTIGHNNTMPQLVKHPARITWMAGFITLALLARALMGFDPDRFFFYMTCAGISFLLATFFWTWLSWPGLWGSNKHLSEPLPAIRKRKA